MGEYLTGGTPWFIVINRKGIIRASHFNPPNLEQVIIDALKEDCISVEARPQTFAPFKFGYESFTGPTKGTKRRDSTPSGVPSTHPVALVG